MSYCGLCCELSEDPVLSRDGERYCWECTRCYVCGEECAEIHERYWAVRCRCCGRPICGAHSKDSTTGGGGYDDGSRCVPPCKETPSVIQLEDAMGYRLENTKERRHQLISEHAYRMWQNEYPGTDQDRWLKAEADYERILSNIVIKSRTWLAANAARGTNRS